MARTAHTDDDEMGSNVSVKAKGPQAEQKYLIVMEESAAVPPGGLFVCGNGVTWLAQPNVELKVPRIFLEILDNAIELVPVVDPLTGSPRRYNKRRKYPYQNFGPIAA